MKRLTRRFHLPRIATFFAVFLVLAPGLRAADAHHVEGCTVASLNGSFGYYRTGFTPDAPLAALGILVFDGKGHSSTTQSISRNGDIEFDISFDGLYEINPDCTGRGLTPDGDEFARLAVINDGNGVLLFSESPGNSVYGVATKMRTADHH
jgi:hypothetical protein